MAKGAYVGVSGVARKVKQPYIGVDNVARLVLKAYVGVDGVARLWFEIAGNKVVQVAAGNQHSLFLTSSMQVYGCGYNGDGQLGRSGSNGSETVVNLGLIPGLSNIVQVAAGSTHSLFLTSSNQVYSCGSNAHGQLGRAVTTGNATTTNLGVISGISGISQAAAGGNTSYFLMLSGQVYDCGTNPYGQLGRSVAAGSQTATNLGLIPGLAGVTQFSSLAGGFYMLFITEPGEVYDCGRNNLGQLGRAVASGSETVVNLGVVDFSTAS